MSHIENQKYRVILERARRLEEERRREEQRLLEIAKRENERKRRAALDAFNIEADKLVLIADKINKAPVENSVIKENPFLRENEEVKRALERTKELTKRLEQVRAKAGNAYSADGVADVGIFLEPIENELKKIDTEFHDFLKKADFDIKSWDEVIKKAQDIDFTATSPLVIEAKRKRAELEKKVQQEKELEASEERRFRDKISDRLAILSIQVLPLALRKKLSNIKDLLDSEKLPVRAKDFYAISAEPVFSECEKEMAKIAQDEKIYHELWERYLVLLKEAGRSDLQFQEKYLPESNQISDIRKAILDLEKEVRENQEASYVKEMFDKVAQEMGYEVIGTNEKTLRDGRKSQRFLCYFQDDIGIDMRYDSDGSFSMQIGKIATEDRLPSKEESLYLEDKMHSFCSSYHKFLKRLEELGITPDTPNEIPPSSAYAQIINANDYGEEAVSKIEALKEDADRDTFAKKDTLKRTL